MNKTPALYNPNEHSLLNDIRSYLIENTKQHTKNKFELKGLWRLDYRYRPSSKERDLKYSIIMAQTDVQGAAYVDFESYHIDDGFLGSDVRELLADMPYGLQIAALDAAAYYTDKKEPLARYSFEGSSSEKVVYRARIICDEVFRVARRTGKKKIINIGVMGSFIDHIVSQRFEYIGVDFEKKLIAEGINDEKVVPGSELSNVVDGNSIIVATGMTLTSNTLNEIVSLCTENSVPLVLFAATAPNFATYYCDVLNIDSVISEYQPQYMFQGVSKIEIRSRTR